MECLGEEFSITGAGVPELFSAALKRIFRKLDWEDFEISINGAKFYHLRFADDLVLITNDAISLQIVLQELLEHSIDSGLTMNSSKTELITSRKRINITAQEENI